MDMVIFLLLLESKLILGQNFHLMKYAGQRLEITYNTMAAVSPIHCNALCKRESSCRSVNYNTVTGDCQPSEICHGDVAGNTVTDQDWDVYTLRDLTNCGCTYNIGSGHNIGTGSIVSKNYPGIYPPYSGCAWLISAPSGHHVTLTFSSMALEDTSNCYYDSIKVYDGYSEYYPLLGMFCGFSPQGPIRSCTGANLYIKFQTDSNTEYGGFRATWNFQTASACGCNYHNINIGTITSPNYPNDYNTYDDCVWVLSARTGTVTFTVTDFLLEYQENCDFDYLEIRNGADVYAYLLAKACGETPPPSVSSTGLSMFIHFKIDLSYEFRGFSATWNMVNILTF